MAETSCLSLPPVRHYIQTLISTGVFRIPHARLRRVVFGGVHHLLIDIQPMNPKKPSTFLSLPAILESSEVFKRQSLACKEKRLCSVRRNANMASDVDLISMSHNGQLIEFCHALPKTESRNLIIRSKQTN